MCIFSREALANPTGGGNDNSQTFDESLVAVDGVLGSDMLHENQTTFGMKEISHTFTQASHDFSIILSSFLPLSRPICCQVSAVAARTFR